MLLAHGIFCDKTEFGRFDRLAAELARAGLASLRFDFRGHGEHALPPIRATIGGMLLDFVTALETLRSRFPVPASCVAASFGGSIALLALQSPCAPALHRLMLLNPVVDYASTFLEPQGQILREAFSAEKWERLNALGFIEPIPGIRLGRVFASELALLRPYAAFERLNVPTRIVHGTADRRVSHDATRRFASESPSVEFVSIVGADHAFIPEPEERRSFDLVLEWLSASAVA